ncbi:unnamed protein product [Effrenium voratum]|nr:unnamed protein product [Effrenium voratum]
MRRALVLKGGFSRAWRWGATEGGLLNQVEAPEISTTPTLIEHVKGVTQAACGSNHSAVVAGDLLYTWGSNKYSQLGRSSTETVGTVELEGPREVALGAFHTACVTNDGVLYTWGWGGSFLGAGALGLGHRNSCALPQKVDFFERRSRKSATLPVAPSIRLC